jgi:REP element-mobilizing transposase RayT
MRQPDHELAQESNSRMAEEPMTLVHQQRQVVEQTITDHCRLRGWNLHAVSCRSNHVHVVVTAPGRHPAEVTDQFESWCTRRLKDQAAGKDSAQRTNWWTQRGSKRWINDEESLSMAIEYVREAQDRVRP